jgi:hypothetical protein
VALLAAIRCQSEPTPTGHRIGRFHSHNLLRWYGVDNATPRFDLASSICCRFVNRFARPKVLSHVSRQRCSPREAHLPSIGAQFRRHQYDEDFRSRFWFAPRALAIPPWFVLAEASTPGWRGAASGQDHCSAGDPVTGAFAPGRERDLSGSQAIHPVPLLRSATPAEPTIPHPWRGLIGAAPAAPTAKASACYRYRGYCGASAPAVYASRAVLPLPMQD